MASTSNWPPAAPAGPRRWTAGRIIGIVLVSLLALSGLGLVVAGGALTVAATTQRDSDGYFHTGAERLSVGSYAITSDEIDLGTGQRPRDWGVELGDILRVRLRVTSADSRIPVFVGIGRADEVRRYLRGVAHDEIRNVDLSPFRVTYRTRQGAREPAPPTGEKFWAASASGTGRQTLRWAPTSGRWVVVVMNADASRGVSAYISVGVQIRHLWLIIGILFGIGGVALVVGVVLIVVITRRAARGTGTPPAAAPGAPSAAPVAGPSDVIAAATAADPVVLVGRLDEPLSPWKWLVKWMLAIPHFVVLVVLWLVVFVLTVVAGLAILFTGRYPRGIFDFNVGVLRWTWRVVFYATGVLGTDRYPPFTLGPVPEYPAALDVAYPESLSRGLVLVKWWLLAIPQYLIVGVITSGAWWGMAGGRGGRWAVGGGGLIGILVLIAAVRLLFTHRYPPAMFDLVMGLHRWVVRVGVYALLMTDVYPPFRLDQGGYVRDPESLIDRR